MDCERMIEAIYLSFDDEVGIEGRGEELKLHLSECSPCARRHLFAGKFLIMLRRRVRRIEAPPALRRRILQSLPHRQQILEKS